MPLFKYAIRAFRLHLWLFAVLIGTLATTQSKQLEDEIDIETDDAVRLRALLETLIERDDLPSPTLHITEYNAMRRVFDQLAAMRLSAEEIKLLDKRFADGISNDEWYDFLLSVAMENRKESETMSQSDNIEEVVAYGYSFRGIPIDPAEMSVSDIGRMRLARERGQQAVPRR